MTTSGIIPPEKTEAESLLERRLQVAREFQAEYDVRVADLRKQGLKGRDFIDAVLKMRADLARQYNKGKTT